MSDDEIKYIDIEEFRDAGFLQEVNRRVLHPAGLALAVSTPWTLAHLDALLKTAHIELDADTLGRLHMVLAYDRWTLTGVWDCRDDREGVVFSDLSEDADAARADRVDEEIARHTAARVTLLGDIVQPVGSVIDPAQLEQVRR